MSRFVRILAVLVLCLGVHAAARAGEADERLAKVAQLDRDLARLGGERRALAQSYDEKAAAIAALKAQPSAWGRDRRPQAPLAGPKARAAALDRKDGELRAVGAARTAEIQAL